MDKFKDKVSHTEDKLPPEFDLVCAPVYNDSIFLPTINLKIRLDEMINKSADSMNFDLVYFILF